MLSQEEILIRLLTAAFLGGLVGFERERKEWAVGIRTHMLASMAAALVMVTSSFGFSDILGSAHVMLDPSRVASSVIIGIGYLGAGMILVAKPGNIKGLTTASGLWTTAGIGLAVGGGLYFAALIATVIALIILYGIQLLQRKLFLLSVRRVLKVETLRPEVAAAVSEKLHDMHISVQHLASRQKKGRTILTATVSLAEKRAMNLPLLIKEVPGVIAVSMR